MNAVLAVANAYAQLQQGAKLETVLEKLVRVTPDSPEAWYNLASTRALLGKSNEALAALGKSLMLSGQRLAQNPKEHDLRRDAGTNQSFTTLRSLPEFQKLIALP